MTSKLFMPKLAVALCATVLSLAAHAGIIGTQLDVGHQYDNRFDFLETVVVQEGNSDAVNVVLGQNNYGQFGYLVDIDSNKIDVTFHYPVGSTWFTSSSVINGLYLSGLSLDANMFKDTAQITNNTMYFSSGRILVMDDHTIGLDFQRLTLSSGLTLSITFDQPAEVDEPASLALFALSAAALRLARRRTKRQARA